MNFDKLTFSKPVTQGDRYFIQVQDGGEPVTKQFNRWMKCKTDLVKDKKHATYIDIHIPGTETDVSPFIEYASDFEEAMLKMTKEKKGEWFPDKEISDEWLDQAFQSGFKQIKKSNDATMRFRVSKDLDVYTSEKEETTPDEIKDGVNIAIIALMDGLWFTKSRFGLTWKVVQAKVKKDKAPSRKYMFDDDAVPEPVLDNVFPDEI
jgi:hypothetical protein